MQKTIQNISRMLFRLILRRLKRDQEFLTWALASLWTAIMFMLLLLPGKMIPIHMVNNEDKFYHFLMFMVFASLVVICIRKYKSVLRMSSSSFVMALGAGYTFLTEFMQGFVPGRSTSVDDGLANIAGVFFGILLTNLLIGYFSRPNKHSFMRLFFRFGSGESDETLRSGLRTGC